MDQHVSSFLLSRRTFAQMVLKVVDNYQEPLQRLESLMPNPDIFQPWVNHFDPGYTVDFAAHEGALRRHCQFAIGGREKCHIQINATEMKIIETDLIEEPVSGPARVTITAQNIARTYVIFLSKNDPDPRIPDFKRQLKASIAPVLGP